MKSRLYHISITNFKAFREFQFSLEGRHLLAYGANGSGKSSLYWALYTFLQSASKPKDGVEKYFNPNASENLLNIHEQKEQQPRPGEIALTLRDMATRNDTTYRISQTDHGTFKQPVIFKGDLASDFITYRFFFGFSHFRNSENFDLWPLFEKEILPFCVSTGGKPPLDMWKRIQSGDPNPLNQPGTAGSGAYNSFRAGTQRFANVLPSIVDSISREAQKFYDTHFSAGDPSKVDLKLAVKAQPSAIGSNRDNFKFTLPVIEFGVRIGGVVVRKPQSFLNEAKLTQLALSVRFAASLVNLHESDLKLLVLDDLLVSLDMSNRMRVVDILLSKTFANYQKIILTHDLGFFLEFYRRIGSDHADWCAIRLDGTASTRIETRSEKTDVQKAEEYLCGHNLDEAALCLRKACEATVKRFIDHNVVIPTREFLGLADALRAARKKILSQLPVQLYEKVIRNTPNMYRHLLIARNDNDLDNDATLPDDVTRKRLKTNRKRLRQLIEVEHVERLRQVKLIDDILDCTERVLNPAVHSGAPPLYEKEIQDALDLVKQLETVLS